jgi:mannose-1-phosphate guanylyltransferase
MNIILLSGGSGARLWPLSNEARSKQFLRLIKNEDGNTQSMVQRVFSQIAAAGLNLSAIVVATSESQVDSIRSQIGSAVEIVTEPERRNTYPAIVLSAAYLHFCKKVKPEEPVIVLPVDSYTEPEFFQTLERMAAVVGAGTVNLALMGAKPTYPSEKYGYIIPLDDGTDDLSIESFIEKPSEDRARELIARGAFWNCGVFAFRLSYVLARLKSELRVTSFEEVRERYRELERNSFDYAVVEKERSIAMIPYTGYWKDLGTWNTFTEQMDGCALGKVLLDDTCENTHVVNELDIPIIVMGAKDMAVVASYDGILVTDKARSANIKPYVEKIQQRPMYEERRWGEYRVLDFVTNSDGSKTLTKRITVLAGKCISYQIHYHRSEVWTIASGKGEFILDDVISAVGRSDVLQIPVGAKHGIKAISDLELIEVQLGMELEESDVIRLAYSW